MEILLFQRIDERDERAVYNETGQAELLTVRTGDLSAARESERLSNACDARVLPCRNRAF